jgi:hypothetical protein
VDDLDLAGAYELVHRGTTEPEQPAGLRDRQQEGSGLRIRGLVTGGGSCPVRESCKGVFTGGAGSASLGRGVRASLVGSLAEVGASGSVRGAAGTAGRGPELRFEVVGEPRGEPTGAGTGERQQTLRGCDQDVRTSADIDGPLGIA